MSDGAKRLAVTLLALSGTSGAASATAATGPTDDNIKLQISPRICTLTERDKQCQTPVHAQWRASHEESLCLVIVTRPDVKHCWEHYAQGTYTIELTFVDDLTFQLRDVSLERVLASEVLRVIREAIRYRHRRRQPWNIFD
ncbi:MAG: DUF3019 domain-containing protein [Sinobacteraceae bacterium]|nr:DUF3019 domain-containing protein [Nevskiaceae bacterium]